MANLPVPVIVSGTKFSESQRIESMQDNDQPFEDPDAWRSRMPTSLNEQRPGRPEDAGRKTHAGWGHRARLRKRLIEGDHDSLADYEVVEFLLFAAIERRDTKPLAKRLLEHFGSISALLNADPNELRRIYGVGDMVIGALKIALVASKHLAATELRQAPVLNNWKTLLDYLATDLNHLKRERARVLYLNGKLELIKDEHLSDGSISESAMHPREVIHRACNLGATALILVHNHPSGDPEPSQADIKLTNRIAEAGRLMDVSVVDHIIMSSSGHVSLKERGFV